MPVERTLSFPGPASPGLTLAPQRRGPGDPCYQLDADRAIWRTSLQNSGPVTARIRRTAPSTVTCQAWGDGADEFVEALPALLGLGDDAGDFTPHHPVIEAAHRRVPHLRLGRTGRVLEALVPAVLEQRVPGADSFRSWRLLVTRFGGPAPGPAPAWMRVP
ncbi:MAG TPA: DNA-3-methyladenine glycosylase 2 family protein, partial [Mycobacterium sp.]|nr:DNA-3-methyladenine glycosylase 2 family protein [Mycobacterium sp.]